MTSHLRMLNLMYRTKIEREAHFQELGRSTKSNWYTKTGHTSTFTFPTTPENKLVTMVKEGLDRCIPGGVSTKSVLVKANPLP